MNGQGTPADSKRRQAAMLGVVAGVLLAVSAFFPYWQARLFAPQYRDGLTATMYLNKVTGDIDEINGLNHYVGVRKFETLAVWEKRIAIPGLLLLIALAVLAFHARSPLPSWACVAGVASFPLVFLADMKYWMHVASTDLDPTAPLKLKPFIIPVLGTGKVGQFKSVLAPQAGFYLALAALALLLAGLWLSRGRKAGGASPKAPLKSLAGALGLLALSVALRAEPLQPLIDAAAPGSTLELGAGRYEGPAVISKTLALKGSGAVVDGGGSGTVLRVTAPGVVLEGLTLRGSGDNMLTEDSGLYVEASSVTARRLALEDVLFGVFASRSPAFVLEDSTLRGKPHDMGRRGDLIRIWNCDRVRLSRNVLSGGRDMVLWFSTGSVIENNTAEGGRYGLHFMHTEDAHVLNNVFRDNSVGLYVMYSRGLELTGNRFERHRGPSGAGVGLKESDFVVARGNVFRDNRQGVFLDQSPVVEADRNVFEGNFFLYNDAAISMMPGVKGNVIAGNSFEDNLQQVSVRGGGVPTGNEWDGNYWSDYAGYGRAGRGLAPYRAERLLERLADAKPLTRFFLYTPAAQAVELAARTFPLFKPKPLIVDRAPLLRAPRAAEPAAPAAPSPVLAALWLPAGLLSVSAAAVALSKKAGGVRPVVPSAARPGPAVEACGLSKSYGERALIRDLSFTAAPGECLVLWGSNGAGKSTLMRCLLGVESFEGSLTVAGFDAARDGAKARERIGYLSQEFAGYDWSVRRAMEFVCEVRGVSYDAIPGALSRCGLAGEADKLVPALSGGMKQKLALAQALIADPEILLLDEPCSSLDLKSRRELTKILSGLKGSRAIVMTSHHLDEVSELADRVLWLDEKGGARSLTPGGFLAEAGREEVLV